MRLVLEPRTSKQDPEEFMRLLMAHTSLEENFPINMVVIGLDGKPQRKNIRLMLEEFLEGLSEVAPEAAPATPSAPEKAAE